MCRRTGFKRGAIDKIEQNTTADKQVGTVNITSFTVGSIGLVIMTKLKTSNYQNSAVIQGKVSIDSDGNIMLYHIFKIVFPGT